MRTLEDFRKYYDATLRAELEEFEQERRGIVRRLGIAAAVALTLAAVGGAAAWALTEQPIALLVLLVLGLIAVGVAYHLLTGDFVKKFKRTVIGGIVRFFDPSLRYNPEGGVSQSQFQASRIFLQGIDRYSREDGVAGALDKTRIEFSEVHAEYKTTTTDKDGHRHEHWHTIFRGLFFIADFNKDFKGLTVVVPDVAERALGKWLGQMLQSINISRQGQLIKLEDPEFERLFAVYGDDQIEARYILTPALMQRIVEYRKHTGRDVSLSFNRSNIYVAVSSDKNMFEPRLFRSLLDFAVAQEYFHDLDIAVSIVDSLNLNTRIWTKE